MGFPWRKAKTPQQINREQKKQDNEAHSRMDSIYAELEQARVNAMFYIAQYSLDLDKRNDELAKLTREFETLSAEHRQAAEELQDLIDAKPEEWKRLNDLTDDPDAKLSGYQKEMVAAMDTTLHLQQAVDNAQLQIGAIKQANETQENVIRTLREQIRTAEYAIDENSVERIAALTDSYVEDEVATQKLMDQLDECADKFNKAVESIRQRAL